MQSDDKIQKLMKSDAFRTLVRKKTRMSCILSLAMLLVYSLYFICIAWLSDWMGSKLFSNGTLSIGVWITVLCVFFSVLISGFYIWWANHYYDMSLQELLNEADDAED